MAPKIPLSPARFAAIAAEVDERWKNLARGPAALTHEQVLALAGELYSDEVAAHQADPGDMRVGAAGGQPGGVSKRTSKEDGVAGRISRRKSVTAV